MSCQLAWLVEGLLQQASHRGLGKQLNRDAMCEKAGQTVTHL